MIFGRVNDVGEYIIQTSRLHFQILFQFAPVDLNFVMLFLLAVVCSLHSKETANHCAPVFNPRNLIDRKQN